MKLKNSRLNKREREIELKIKTRMKETDWNQMTVVDKLLKELKRHCYRSQQVFVHRSRA